MGVDLGRYATEKRRQKESSKWTATIVKIVAVVMFFAEKCREG